MQTLMRKKAGAALLMSDKAECRSEITRDKERYHMRKGSVHQRDIAVLKVYAPNTEP